MTQQMKFITLDQFKAELGIDKIDVVSNPAKGTTFAIHAKGTSKVQQDLNPALPVRYMYEEDKFTDGCIVNVKPLDVKFSL
jgi:hypothetical protein